MRDFAKGQFGNLAFIFLFSASTPALFDIWLLGDIFLSDIINEYEILIFLLIFLGPLLIVITKGSQ